MGIGQAWDSRWRASPRSPGVRPRGVLEATPGGFALKTTVTIAAPGNRVYDALTRPWDGVGPGHTYSGDAANLSIDPRPGGCFCERGMPKQGGVQHAMVVLAIPGKTLRLVGGLGPLQDAGLAAADVPVAIAKAAPI